MSIIKIGCNKCHYENQVKFTPEIGGRRIMFKCKNSTCDEMITIKMPAQYREEHSTVVTHSEDNGIDTAYLEIRGDENQLKYPLRKGNQVIGRRSLDKFPDIPLNIEDKTVSRTHCIIEGIVDAKDNLCYILQEKNSKNGIYLNGMRLTEDDELYLEDGDEIQLGHTCLIFRGIKHIQ